MVAENAEIKIHLRRISDGHRKPASIKLAFQDRRWEHVVVDNNILQLQSE